MLWKKSICNVAHGCSPSDYRGIEDEVATVTEVGVMPSGEASEERRHSLLGNEFEKLTHASAKTSHSFDVVRIIR